MERPSRGLIRHELSHACGALSAGASRSVITHDGQSWRTDHKWPAEPSEFQTMCGFLAGPMLQPAHASDEDNFMMLACPQELRERVQAFVMAVVAPQIAEVTDAQLDAMIDTMLATGGLMLEADAPDKRAH